MKKIHFGIAALAAFSLLLNACSKEKDPCTSYTAENNSGHLTDISILSTKAPEFLDTLAKYPQLQVHSIAQQGDEIRMDCYVYHEGLRMFSYTYGLGRSGSASSIRKLGDNQTEFDIPTSVTPVITPEEALTTARAALDFQGQCLTYTFGIINVNTLTGEPGTNNKLAWRVAAEGSNAAVTVDAQTNEVILVNTRFFE